MLYSIDMPPRNRPRLSQGVRAVLAMIFLVIVIAMAVYFVDRFGDAAMVVGV